jgi:hypothetical protein
MTSLSAVTRAGFRTESRPRDEGERPFALVRELLSDAPQRQDGAQHMGPRSVQPTTFFCYARVSRPTLTRSSSTLLNEAIPLPRHDEGATYAAVRVITSCETKTVHVAISRSELPPGMLAFDFSTEGGPLCCPSASMLPPVTPLLKSIASGVRRSTYPSTSKAGASCVTPDPRKWPVHCSN